MSVAVDECLTQVEAAARLDISTSWLRELTRRGVVSRNEDGSYPWPTIQREYEAFQADAAEDRSSGFGDGGYQEARARKTAMQARLAELQVAEREGQLIHIDDMEQLLRRPIERVDNVLQAATNKYAPTLAREAGIDLATAKDLLGDVFELVRGELREAS